MSNELGSERAGRSSGLRRFIVISIAIVALELLIMAVCSFLVLGSLKQDAGRQYRVDISRAVMNLKQGEAEDAVTAKYSSITRISEFDPGEKTNSDYTVEEVNGKLYRFEYRERADLRPLIFMNIGLAIAILFTVIVLIYVERKVLRPFHRMSNLSVELARGNLTSPVQAEKNKFFGKFLWGINMLRDNLESNKEKELAMQKDKKTLILSLSHDIKTPLSAIKLYARALDEDLYDTEEKRREAISGISHNASEIERYVSDIVTASKEDFLNLEVQMEEFYLDAVIRRIETLYSDKFSSLRTKFTVDTYSNVLLSADSARLEEVLQNILENAIKYGDGQWVEISFSDEEDCRLITIRNSGCTLKEDEIPHLFESFYRGSNAEKVGGSGLGLYIARSLMRMMNGDIYAECETKEGTGAFAVTVVVKKA